jgi:hypothetical protein
LSQNCKKIIGGDSVPLLSLVNFVATTHAWKNAMILTHGDRIMNRSLGVVFMCWVVFFAGNTVHGGDGQQPTQREVDAFISASKAYTKSQMKDFTTKKVAVLINKIKTSTQDKKISQKRVTALQKLIRDSRSGKCVWPAPLEAPYEIGKIGLMQNVSVSQVVDATNMTVRPSGSPSLLRRLRVEDELLWVTGIDTTNCVDGKTTCLLTVMWIPATTTYTNAAKSQTTVPMATKLPLKLLNDNHILSMEEVIRILAGK